VPSAAANFVELEALRWENRKLTDAKLVAETQVSSLPSQHGYPRFKAAHCRLHADWDNRALLCIFNTGLSPKETQDLNAEGRKIALSWLSLGD
jgi:hypothetical protein